MFLYKKEKTVFRKNAFLVLAPIQNLKTPVVKKKVQKTVQKSDDESFIVKNLVYILGSVIVLLVVAIVAIVWYYSSKNNNNEEQDPNFYNGMMPPGMLPPGMMPPHLKQNGPQKTVHEQIVENTTDDEINKYKNLNENKPEKKVRFKDDIKKDEEVDKNEVTIEEINDDELDDDLIDDLDDIDE